MYSPLSETRTKRHVDKYVIHIRSIDNPENNKLIEKKRNDSEGIVNPFIKFEGVLQLKNYPFDKLKNRLFEMDIKVTSKAVVIKNVKPVNIANRFLRYRELFFNILIRSVIDKYWYTINHKDLLISSNDFFIQEPLLDNGFNLVTVEKDSGSSVYTGVLSKRKKG